MLVGSGGVVALVIGAWSVVWALRTLPRGVGRGWWPMASAFLAAMLGMALISSFEEPMLGFTGVIRGGYDERLAALQAVRVLWYRPLAAVAIGEVALGVAVFVANAMEKEPGARDFPEVDRVEKIGVALATALGAAAVVTLGLFGGTIGGVEPTIASVIANAAQLQLLTRIGVSLASGLVLTAAFLGAWRARRAWSASRAKDPLPPGAGTSGARPRSSA